MRTTTPPPLHNRNTARRPIATALSLGALAAVVLGPAAAARQPAPPAPDPLPPVAASAPAAATPSPARTLAAFSLVESWVRAGVVPAEPPAQALAALKDTDLPGDAPLTGAAVQLRLAGRLIGRGSDMGGGGSGPASLWLAAREAWAEAAPRLPSAGGAGLESAAAARETLGQIMISVELAGPPIVITPVPATHEDVSLSLAPGLDGVAVRFGAGGGGGGGGGRTAAIFPGQMLAANMLPGAALAAAASRAGGDAALGLVPPKDLVDKHGAVLMRFRVSHAAQPGPGTPSEFLDRGGRTIQTADMTAAQLRSTAERLAAHLHERADAAVYEPWRDATAGAPPTPALELLAAFALRQHLEQARWPGVSTAEPARTLVARFIAEQGALAPDAPRTADNAAAAALAALCGMGGDASPTVRDAMAAVFSADTGFRDDVPAPARGLIACGLVRVAGAAEDPAALALAEAAVRTVFRETPDGQLVSQMPWLGWAEIELAALKRARDPGAPGDIPAAVALRRMREQVWEHMITAADAKPDEQDMIGAIVFTRAANQVPTWQSARPLAFIATMLADERLTGPEEFNTELVRLLTSLRFLRQLQADGTSMWMCPSRDRALGGIRESLWDQRMPLEASALTLLTVARTLESLERRAGVPAPAPKAVQP